MADKKTRSRSVARRRNQAPSVTVPGTNTEINLPDRAGVFWYAGLATMAAVELVEWPIAALIAGTHFVSNHSHRRDIQELAEGIDAAA